MITEANNNLSWTPEQAPQDALVPLAGAPLSATKG